MLATLAVVAVTFHINSPDQYTYLGYTDGLQQGRYTYWATFADYLPDTFRNPGYPLFLLLLKQLGMGVAGMRVVQIGLYAATIGIVLHLARRCEQPGSWLVRNLFLLLLLPNVQMAYFAAVIYPEILVVFLLAAYTGVALTWASGTWRRTVTLALLAGLIFQVRPIFIFFPALHLAVDFWHARPHFAWGQAVGLLALFGATMLPYAAWNHHHHGVWKPTSLEGGAGVTQLGFWALRLPGYKDSHYWTTQMGNEVVQFVDPAEVPGYIAAYNQEWDTIEAQCRPFLSARDRHYMPLMAQQPLLFPTYSSAYTLQREHLLMQYNVAHIRQEPLYYLKTRLYTLVRLWVTGVQRDAWQAATTPVAKLKVLYPALVSGFTFLLALVSITWAGLRARLSCRPTWWLSLALVMYFGVMHLPFAIQARYTVPVRPWLLLATALALAAWLTRRLHAPARANVVEEG
ncbi:MAG: hypothetical protein ACRYFX_20020 [Janthinobacterium lividum]